MRRRPKRARSKNKTQQKESGICVCNVKRGKGRISMKSRHRESNIRKRTPRMQCKTGKQRREGEYLWWEADRGDAEPSLSVCISLYSPRPLSISIYLSISISLCVSVCVRLFLNLSSWRWRLDSPLLFPVLCLCARFFSLWSDQERRNEGSDRSSPVIPK